MRDTVIIAALAICSAPAAGQVATQSRPADVPEHVYRGALIGYPGQWAFALGKSSIILVSDEQLEALCDPDKPVDLSIGSKPHEQTLRQVCEYAKAAGQRTLILAFDEFFAKYRASGEGGKPRRLTPDRPESIEKIAILARFAQQYGLGLELSLLSPLEIGSAYVRETGESGFWMHYREGVRDPRTGAYSVQLWRQTRWVNNKGAIDIADAGVRVFAFREQPVGGTPYFAVNPAEITEISETAATEVFEGLTPHDQAIRIRVYGRGRTDLPGLDRVLVIQQYRTPEMDYFSEQAAPYLRRLIDRYVDAGVRLNGLYADEMHIQQDWRYSYHHDHGEFALRYVSPGLQCQFAKLYGEPYRDFARYLVYFACGQHDFVTGLGAKQGAMHVLGDTPEAIAATALLRSRYYRLLQDGVVDLFAGAKRYFEQCLGYRLEARAHATWAESPTCDVWDLGRDAIGRTYDYTSSFVWSNTVQQAASACHDYFKWGDFLTGNGNDDTEGGFLDRDYFALAMACSTGILNDVLNSYAAHWGMPQEVSRRRFHLVDAFGCGARPFFAAVESGEHRDVQVLMLYPLDLVAADERFGSVMTQYGYANYVTQAKLLERGRVRNGAIEMAGRRFTTLVALFEPFPSRSLLEMMQQLAEQGGRVIWSGPPPVLLDQGEPAMSAWRQLVGADYRPSLDDGQRAAGHRVSFEGPLASVSPMTILTDFIVDHVYPLSPQAGTEVAARMDSWVVGTIRRLASGGSITALGFRPQDDQSRSLGYETRCWFEILTALGAYPPTGRFGGVNDNTEYLSRTGEYLFCRFPNGTVAVAPHLRELRESWPGKFMRDPEGDRKLLEGVVLPSEEVLLKDLKVNGHTVSYEGRGATALRVNQDGELIAFCGSNCARISVDGRATVFADKPVGLVAWAPVDPARRVPGGAVQQIWVNGPGPIHVPLLADTPAVEIVAEGATPGSRGHAVPFKREAGGRVLTVDQPVPGQWMYVVTVPANSSPTTRP